MQSVLAIRLSAWCRQHAFASAHSVSMTLACGWNKSGRISLIECSRAFGMPPLRHSETDAGLMSKICAQRVVPPSASMIRSSLFMPWPSIFGIPYHNREGLPTFDLLGLPNGYDLGFQHQALSGSARPDAITVRGFIYDVDTGKLEEVSYPGPMGSIG